MNVAGHHGEAEQNRRQYKRTSAMLSGTLFHDDRVDDCVIFNLSLGGAMVRFSETLADRAAVTLSVSRAGALRAEAVWQTGKTLGLRFFDAPERVADVIGDTLSRRRPMTLAN